MAGYVHNVIPRRTFDFAGAGLNAQLFPVGLPIDITHYTIACLVVRVHSASFTGSNAINFNVFYDGYLDGSERDFLGDVIGVGIHLSQPDTPPYARFAPNLVNGQYISVQVSGNSP